jgi:hypothetical protein
VTKDRGLLFTLHYGMVETDGEVPYVGRHQFSMGSKEMPISEIYARAKEVAEATGFPTRLVCRAINADRTFTPDYLDFGKRPDHL